MKIYLNINDLRIWFCVDMNDTCRNLTRSCHFGGQDWKHKIHKKLDLPWILRTVSIKWCYRFTAAGHCAFIPLSNVTVLINQSNLNSFIGTTGNLQFYIRAVVSELFCNRSRCSSLDFMMLLQGCEGKKLDRTFKFLTLGIFCFLISYFFNFLFQEFMNNWIMCLVFLFL